MFHVPPIHNSRCPCPTRAAGGFPGFATTGGTAATGAAIAAGVVTLKCVSGTTTAATSRGPQLGIVAVTAAGGSTRLWQRPVSLQEGWVQLRVEVPLQQEQEEGEPEDGQA